MKKANVDCLLRKIIKHAKEVRLANSMGDNIQSEIQHLYSLLGSIRLEIIDTTKIQRAIEKLGAGLVQ